MKTFDKKSLDNFMKMKAVFLYVDLHMPDVMNQTKCSVFIDSINQVTKYLNHDYRGSEISKFTDYEVWHYLKYLEKKHLFKIEKVKVAVGYQIICNILKMFMFNYKISNE